MKSGQTPDEEAKSNYIKTRFPTSLAAALRNNTVPQIITEGEPPFRMTVGNATGVELLWGGETVDLQQRAGRNNVARFTLGE